MRKEISAGGVVFKRNHGVKILLIKDSFGRWGLPKGIIEKNETSEEAALREISEEVGLKDLDIKEKLGEVKYFYKLKGETIFKIVIFFLIESKSEKTKISWEIKDAKWFSPEEAIKTIEYKNTKGIVKKAIEKIRSKLK